MPYREKDHYPTISRWWREYDGTVCVPRACFPPTGIVATLDGEPAAVSFAYLTNAAVAQIAFVIADPALPALRRIEAATRAVDVTIALCKAHIGDEGLISIVTHNPTMHALVTRRLGFVDGGKAYTSFLAVGEGIDPAMIS